MMTKIAKALPEFSVTGAAGAYLAWVVTSGAEPPIDPFWVICTLTAVFFSLGLYRAWADDGKITLDEVTALLGMTHDEFVEAVEAAKSKSDGAIPSAVEDEPTPIIDIRDRPGND